MISFFLKMETSGIFLCWRLFQRGTAVIQRGFYVHYNSGCKTFCSPAEGLPPSAWNVFFFCDRHAQRTPSLCATGISELIDGMQSFVTPRWRCGNDRMAGKHHCTAVIPVTPIPACFTPVSSFVHSCPVAGLSIFHCRVKPLTVPATEISGALLAQSFQQNGWGVIYWGNCGPCLLYFINPSKWLNSTVLCPLRWLQKTVVFICTWRPNTDGFYYL